MRISDRGIGFAASHDNRSPSDSYVNKSRSDVVFLNADFESRISIYTTDDNRSPLDSYVNKSRSDGIK